MPCARSSSVVVSYHSSSSSSSSSSNSVLLRVCVCCRVVFSKYECGCEIVIFTKEEICPTRLTFLSRSFEMLLLPLCLEVNSQDTRHVHDIVFVSSCL